MKFKKCIFLASKIIGHRVLSVCLFMVCFCAAFIPQKIAAQQIKGSYTIKYDIPAGVTNPTSNPTSYTVSDSVKIANPSMPGYTFKGWTIRKNIASDNLNVVVKDVSWVPNTSFEDITFIVELPPTEGGDNANWSENVYTITYDYSGHTIPATANPATYTISTPDITLKGTTYNGYAIAEWKIVSDSASVTVPAGKQIPKGTYGNLTCTAVWKQIKESYTIKYIIPDGVTNPETNPTSYTVYDSVKIANPSMPGYTFKGWTIRKNMASENLNVIVKNISWMPNTVFEDITFIVELPPAEGGDNDNWSENVYNITYDYSGHTIPETANPATYTISTPDITLKDTTYNGYAIAEWKIVSDSASVTVPAGKQIPKGTYGNLTCTAVFGVDNTSDEIQKNDNDYQLYQLDAVDNENIRTLHVWSHNNMLYIKSDTDNTAYIYNLNGMLCKKINVKQGSTNIEMARGLYVVIIDGHQYKVIIK